MKKERESNIELMRIVLMLAIIAHHLVVNSGVMSCFNYVNPTSNMIFLLLFGFAGKTAINGFLLISGYFMAKSRFSFDKLARLYLEVKFYGIVIYVIFLACKIEIFTVKGLIKTIFNVAYDINISFVSTFLMLYILSPFINKIIINLSRKLYLSLICVLLFFFTIISTFFYPNDTFCEIGWYVTVYLIGGYINLYPLKIFSNIKVTSLSFFASLICSYGSILFMCIINKLMNQTYTPYYFLGNANKIMAVLLSVTMFLFFKNLHIDTSKTINKVASTVFGILLIHANSDAMRSWLWGNIVDVVGHYNFSYLPLYAATCVVIIFGICMSMELLRKKFIEDPLLKHIINNKRYMQIKAHIEDTLNS